MPRDYGKIRHGFWSGTGETSRQLRKMPMDVRTVAAYLLSCGSSNMIGLYYLPLPIIAHEIGSGLTIEGALKALRSLGELGFAFYDEQSETVFVPNMAREQIAEELSATDKQRQGVIALLKEYEKSRFVADFVRIYGKAYHLPEGLDSHVPSKAHPSPIEGPSKPENREQRSGEQDQGLSLSRDPGAGTTEPAAQAEKLPTAFDWSALFSAKYFVARGQPYGRGEADAKAEGRFCAYLESLPAEQRVSDWDARIRIVTEFLTSTSPATVSAGWSFSFFVAQFRGLSIPPERRPKPAPRSEARGFAQAKYDRL
jgi:hypothetical protein